MDHPRAWQFLLFAAVFTAFAGCAAERGEILGASPLGYTDAAFLSVPEDEYFWIAPPAGPHQAQPVEMQIPKDGLWVREGWFNVEFQCYSPRDAAGTTTDYPILPETQDEKAVYIHAGHRYRLSCSPTRVGVFDIDEQDAAPAQ